MTTGPGSITDVSGIQVGHAQNEVAATGCTVVLCEKGAVAGVDQCGGAPGTRETDLLKPVNLVEQVHAILLTGGSAFGLDAAGGIMRYLEERGIGFDTGVAKVPIVPGAVLFDLAVGDAKARPDAEMGYAACLNASGGIVAQGNVGAGTGASVGKIFGMKSAMKAGIGTASIHLPGGVIIGALIAVNAFGDVINPVNGEIVAGARKPGMKKGHDKNLVLLDTLDAMKKPMGKMALRIATSSNTIIGVVATNARLDKTQANRMAMMAQDGIARTIRPAHTMLDGDTLFTLSTGKRDANLTILGAFAAEVVAQAILNAVWQTNPAYELPTILSYGQ